MTRPEIRFARLDDLDTIVQLCKAHADYEQAEYFPKGKKDQLARDLFSDNPKLYCLVAEVDEHIAGYATYMEQYATWEAGEYIYMDCLYVIEEYRSHGIGEMLVNRIRKEARLLNCRLIQWQTPSFNTRAMKFYSRIGASAKSKERFFLTVNS